MIRVFTEWLRAGRPFVYARMGDGELACMRGDQGENCDGSPYSSRLAQDLQLAYTCFGLGGAFLERHVPLLNQGGEWFPHTLTPRQADDAYAEWEQFWGYAPWVKCSLAHRVDIPLLPVRRFWETLRDLARPKVLVGGERVLRLKADFGFDCMYVTHPQLAYESATEAAMVAAGEAGDRGIVVLACGMASKVIMQKLMERRPNATLIDAGSAFDPLYGYKSRTGQLVDATFDDLYGR
jgi:hypothetical protein